MKKEQEETQIEILTRLKTLRQVLNSQFLILETRAILVVQPTKLLQNLGMVWIIVHNTFVSILGTTML